MATLTDWLKLMLAEIARKQEEAALAAAEQQARQASKTGAPAAR
ncbi:MAG: hypothetical protein U1F39_10490 [Steroidobacteraceae bacterium]